ncbi:MAG: glutamine--fructose-6-phosphate transaminase (isomerizing) [Holosporales bacterium]|jgi:glucosamine--fructose-6-phosphate aminotransferase (isomerizing)|nr:glutamine--fructose-6-phosphate transaminase (isomerizing) [Holosporales bacterium]
MCGIVALASKHGDVVDRLVTGLTALEYRGYDSAGLSTVSSRALHTYRAVGRVENLRNVIPDSADASIGIAHTRWAVMGAVTEENAHPQSDGETAVVHNGIIENAHELKILVPDAHWTGQTDTEILVHLISKFVTDGHDFAEAVQETVRLIKGTYAIAAIHKNFPGTIIGVRHINPLAVGIAQNGDLFLTSDIAAVPLDKFVDLDDGDICVIKRCDNANIQTSFFNFDGELAIPCEKEWQEGRSVSEFCGLGDSPDFTIKEIREQPQVIQKCVDALQNGIYAPFVECLQTKELLNLVGCGSSFHAGLIGKYWVRKYLGMFACSEIASEFKFENGPISKKSLNIFISQSGETLDTIRALEDVRGSGGEFAVLTNVLHSTMAKITPSNLLVGLNAGPEFSVVSTKAFLAQVATLLCIAIQYLNARNPKLADSLTQDLERVPYLIGEIAQHEYTSPLLQDASSISFLGRGLFYPLALEAALKLKEITYLQAEGLPGGEMKHGDIGLIDSRSVCVVIAPTKAHFRKIASNVH